MDRYSLAGITGQNQVLSGLGQLFFYFCKKYLKIGQNHHIFAKHPHPPPFKINVWIIYLVTELVLVSPEHTASSLWEIPQIFLLFKGYLPEHDYLL